MKKRPAGYTNFPEDWLGSGRVAALSNEEYRAYRTLVDLCWTTNCELPESPDELAKMLPSICSTGCTEQVLECFDKHPDKPNKITHRKLWAQFEKWQSVSEARARAGRASGASRRRTKTGTQRGTKPADVLPYSVKPRRDVYETPPHPSIDGTHVEHGRGRVGGGDLAAPIEESEPLTRGSGNDPPATAGEPPEAPSGELPDPWTLCELQAEHVPGVSSPSAYVHGVRRDREELHGRRVEPDECFAWFNPHGFEPLREKLPERKPEAKTRDPAQELDELERKAVEARRANEEARKAAASPEDVSELLKRARLGKRNQEEGCLGSQ